MDSPIRSSFTARSMGPNGIIRLPTVHKSTTSVIIIGSIAKNVIVSLISEIVS